MITAHYILNYAHFRENTAILESPYDPFASDAVRRQPECFHWNRICPASGFTKPVMALKKVVLPAPFGDDTVWHGYES
jgi:hypothetical protein